MSDTLRPARLDWSQGSPRSADFDDVYFSSSGGDAETRHVFLDGNRLKERFSSLAPEQSFTIIETGFGTGLNWLCTQELWKESGRTGWLHMVSVEKHPLSVTDLARAQAEWPLYAAFASLLQTHYPELVSGFHRLVFPELRSTLTLVFADISDALPRIHAVADAWFLDGFSPGRNPGMWQPDLYEQMARLSKANSSFSTFTAAGDVRRGLAAAGFHVEKVPGHGKKREMLKGYFSGYRPQSMPSPAEKPWLHRPSLPANAMIQRKAVIIGAGIAGASTAHALAQRGWEVTVMDQGEIANAASGNPAAVIALSAAPEGQSLDHFLQQAGTHTLRELRADKESTATFMPAWHPCGVLELPTSKRRKKSGTERPMPGLPSSLWQTVDPEEASDKAGINIHHEAVWQPQSGWMDATAFCQKLLHHPLITVCVHTRIAGIDATESGWCLKDHEQEIIATSPVVVIAASHEAQKLAQCSSLPLNIVRGQLSLVEKSDFSGRLKTIICEQGYITPALPNSQHCMGASFVPDDSSRELRKEEHEQVLRQLETSLPDLAASLPETGTWQGRSSLRCQSPDYLPLIGPLADPSTMMQDYAGLKDGKLLHYPLLATLPGLYVNLAHGSHGFSQALLAAEILASELGNEPSPVSRKTLDSLHPMRFVIRQIKRREI